MTERDPDNHTKTSAGRKALIDKQWLELKIESVVACQLRAQLRSKEAADDAAQDVYLELLDSDEVQPGADLLELACRLAARMAARRRVRRWRRLQLLRRHWQDSQHNPEQTLTPDRVHELQDMLAIVEQILLEFPAGSTDIFQAYVGGELRSTIAARLGIPGYKVYQLIEQVHTRILEVLPMPGEREP